MRDLNEFPYHFCAQPNSFAEYTFTKRLPHIINEIILHNNIKIEQTNKLQSIANNLETITADRIHQESNELWKVFYEQYEGHRIKEVPFFFAEIYFYALINHLVENKFDPFEPIKSKDIHANAGLVQGLWNKKKELTTSELILLTLNGNKADLSQINKPENRSINLLVDDTKCLVAAIPQIDTIHYILDNAGVELFTDLLLANHIIDTYNKRIILHVKQHPLFVSDTMKKDVITLLNHLKFIEIGDFSLSIASKIKTGQIIIEANSFWNAPLHFTHLTEFSGIPVKKNDLIISKGDANFRRFFEDRQIPLTIKPALYAGYLPCTAFVIRTLKSEIQVGLSQDQIDSLNQQPNWMTNGEFGVIQKLTK